MKAKHTPGPWLHAGSSIWGPKDARSHHKNGRTLIGGVVDTHTDWKGTTSESKADRVSLDAEASANAHLIAAAPDLLEACKASLDALRYASGLGPEHWVVRQLYSAIAKTEGNGR